MKKQYIVPTTKIVMAESENVICTSADVKGEFRGGLTVGGNSRSNNDWDDDDEDLW